MPLAARLQLTDGAAVRVGAARIAVLEAIAREGSISAAARALGLSYRGAQDALQALHALAGCALVETRAGGREGGSARVTPAGAALVMAFRRLDRELDHVVGQLQQHLAEGGEPLDRLAWRLGMKTSARNTLFGVVERVTPGAVNSEVVLRVGEALRIVAIVTARSVEELGLEPGREAAALVKAGSVILAPGHDPLRTSARNRLLGQVVEHREGAVNDEVVLEVEGGARITATVTRESGEALGLAVGAPAQALIKASHVILAVD
jgi:molybdate transport system regulatory protein